MTFLPFRLISWKLKLKQLRRQQEGEQEDGKWKGRKSIVYNHNGYSIRVSKFWPSGSRHRSPGVLRCGRSSKDAVPHSAVIPHGFAVWWALRRHSLLLLQHRPFSTAYDTVKFWSRRSHSLNRRCWCRGGHTSCALSSILYPWTGLKMKPSSRYFPSFSRSAVGRRERLAFHDLSRQGCTLN